MDRAELLTSYDEQCQVFQEAEELMYQRNAVHQDLWKKSGAAGNLPLIKHKLARINSLLMLSPDTDVQAIVDEALDLLNYTAFLIRCVREGRFEDETADLG